MENNLTNMEEALVDVIVFSNSSHYKFLEEQIPNLSVKSREFTGVGAFIHFNLSEYDANKIPSEFRTLNTCISASKLLTLDTVLNPISFELCTTNGLIDFLEIVINGDEETWKRDYNTFELSDQIF